MPKVKPVLPYTFGLLSVIGMVGIGSQNQPRYPGTKANIGRGTQGTAADFSRGTLWLDQSEAQEFWGLLIGRAKGTAAVFGRGTRVPRPTWYPGTKADFSLGTMYQGRLWPPKQMIPMTD